MVSSLGRSQKERPWSQDPYFEKTRRHNSIVKAVYGLRWGPQLVFLGSLVTGWTELIRYCWWIPGCPKWLHFGFSSLWKVLNMFSDFSSARVSLWQTQWTFLALTMKLPQPYLWCIDCDLELMRSGSQVQCPGKPVSLALFSPLVWYSSPRPAIWRGQITDHKGTSKWDTVGKQHESFSVDVE